MDKREKRKRDGEWHACHVRMKECCLHTGCQLRLLILEITQPEQTGQGQTSTHSGVKKKYSACYSELKQGKELWQCSKQLSGALWMIPQNWKSEDKLEYCCAFPYKDGYTAIEVAHWLTQTNNLFSILLISAFGKCIGKKKLITRFEVLKKSLYN